jgi:hypothetical protein
MIISHKHRFIFVAVPKTGTHSVRRALRGHLGPEDHEQVGLFVQKKMPYPDIAAIKHGHITLPQIRPHVGEQAFKDFFKFAFVRNPFERFVSYCAFASRKAEVFGREIPDIMRNVLLRPPLRHILFVPQHCFITDEDGNLLADGVGRVEDMQAHYDQFCARLGLPTRTLETANATKHDTYRSYYDNHLIDAVSRLYRKDLDLFGYEF